MPIFIPAWLIYLGTYLGGFCSGLTLVLLAVPFLIKWAQAQEHKLQAQVRISDREAEIKTTQERYKKAVDEGPNAPK